MSKNSSWEEEKISEKEFVEEVIKKGSKPKRIWTNKEINERISKYFIRTIKMLWKQTLQQKINHLAVLNPDKSCEKSGPQNKLINDSASIYVAWR